MKYGETGKYIGVIACLKTKEREKKFIYSKEALYKTKTVFFHLKSLDFKWKEYADLKKIKIGGTQNYLSSTFLEKKGFKIDYAPKEDLTFKKLFANRFDVYATDLLVGLSLINDIFSSEEVALFTNHPKELFSENVYVVFSKKSPNAQEMADKFDKGLKKLKQTGRYEEIISNFFKISR